MTAETTIIVRGSNRHLRLLGAPRYFHGGIPGLPPGACLLPPTRTRTAKTTSRFVGPEDIAPWLRRRDRVYVTPHIELAWIFAGAYPNGALYEVYPAMPRELDPDSSVEGASWRCPYARVLDVIVPAVDPSDVVAEMPIEELPPIIARKLRHALAERTREGVPNGQTHGGDPCPPARPTAAPPSAAATAPPARTTP